MASESFSRTSLKFDKQNFQGRVHPRPDVGYFRFKSLIRSIITFDPDPSLHISTKNLAFLIMSCNPIPPTIMITGNPDPLPGSWKPFPNRFPVAWNKFRLRRRWGTIIRLRRRIINHPGWRGRVTIDVVSQQTS
jgi:hypothetical protein